MTILIVIMFVWFVASLAMGSWLALVPAIFFTWLLSDYEDKWI